MDKIIKHAILLTQELIAIPSESANPTRTIGPCEAGIFKALRQICLVNNILWEEQEVFPGRYNFMASLPRPSAPKILLVAHMDTVSGKEMPTPFLGEIRDDKIWGRGACDDKGPLATLFATLMGLKKIGTPLPYDITVVASVDEECSMAGSAKLARENPEDWDLCLALEPSLLQPISTHIGVYRCRILPEPGKSKQNNLQQIIEDLNILQKEISTEEHPKLGKAVMTVTEIKGDKQQAISKRNRILVDIRLLPSQSPAKIHASIKKIVGIKGRVIPLFTGLGIDSAPTEPLINAFQNSLTSQGLNNELIGVHFPSDCSQLRNRGPCLVWGPGDPAVAHGPNEHIAISQIKGACRVLYNFLSQGI